MLSHACILDYNDWQVVENKAGKQNIACLFMISLDVRKLILPGNYAVVEITFMMTQRALIPRPLGFTTTPWAGGRSHFIEVRSAALVLFPPKHVEGHTNGYKSRLNTSLFQEGCKQGAKRAVRECDVPDEHSCFASRGISTCQMHHRLEKQY